VTIPSPVEFLAQVEFFSALRAEELEQIETQVQSKWYDLGETVANAESQQRASLLCALG
jgi:signal-transduction protein with cAMP-binding, CBS, and nucleotidyltransferase domain